MTINELEQGMRNLIATQPMVTAGANGEVVNGVLSIIDAFRNLSFRVQTYPCQDVLKFTMGNESAKLENNLCSLVCQVMQERGINLMLYIAPAQNRFGPMGNQYGMIKKDYVTKYYVSLDNHDKIELIANSDSSASDTVD